MADSTSAVLRWSARSETVGTPSGRFSVLPGLGVAPYTRDTRACAGARARPPKFRAFEPAGRTLTYTLRGHTRRIAKRVDKVPIKGSKTALVKDESARRNR